MKTTGSQKFRQLQGRKTHHGLEFGDVWGRYVTFQYIHHEAPRNSSRQETWPWMHFEDPSHVDGQPSNLPGDAKAILSSRHRKKVEDGTAASVKKTTVSVISCSLGFPSGKLTQLWKITIFMGNLTISMAIFHSYVSLPEVTWKPPSTNHPLDRSMTTEDDQQTQQTNRNAAWPLCRTATCVWTAWRAACYLPSWDVLGVVYKIDGGFTWIIMIIWLYQSYQLYQWYDLIDQLGSTNCKFTT